MTWLHPSYILHVAVWKTPEEAGILFTHQENGDRTPQDISVVTHPQVNPTLSRMPRTRKMQCEGGWGWRGQSPASLAHSVGKGPQPLTMLPSVLNPLLSPACFLSHRVCLPQVMQPEESDCRLPTTSSYPELQTLFSVARSRARGEL